MPRFGNYTVKVIGTVGYDGSTMEFLEYNKILRVNKYLDIMVLSAGPYHNPESIVRLIKAKRLVLMDKNTKRKDIERHTIKHRYWPNEFFDKDDATSLRIEIIALEVDRKNPKRYKKARNYWQNGPFTLTEDKGETNPLVFYPSGFISSIRNGREDIVELVKELRDLTMRARSPLAVFDHKALVWYEFNTERARKETNV